MYKLVKIIQRDSCIVSKSVVRSMNSSKNKLNIEIIFIYNPNSNARLVFNHQKKENKKLQFCIKIYWNIHIKSHMEY